jgi:hypothetical protein
MYTPRSVDDILINAESIDSIRTWLLHGDGICVISQEQTGCGVSTLLTLLTETLSDSIEVLHTLDTGTTSKMTVLGQKKVLVIDPLETLLMADQVASRALPSLLANPPVPILIAGFQRRVSFAKLEDMLKKCKHKSITRIHIPPLQSDRVCTYLASLGCSDPQAVWKESGGDLRHSIMSLGNTSIKDRLPDGAEGLHEILSGTSTRSYADLIRVIENDPTIMMDGLFENYVHGTNDPVVCSEVLDAISATDLFHTHQYTTTVHDMTDDIYGVLAGIGYMGIRLNKPIHTFGTVWARENHKYSKVALLKKIMRENAPFMNMENIPHMRHMIYTDPEGQVPRLASSYGDKSIWNVTRLWPQSARLEKYTTSKHASLLQPPQQQDSVNPHRPQQGVQRSKKRKGASHRSSPAKRSL